MNRLLLTLAAATLACTTPLNGDGAHAARIELPVFPGAAGFGTTTIAGRGGRVLRVTNLNDDGPGSLRAALTASGPRVVIFEVSGIIDLQVPIYVGAPYVTVAGQTAPSPGIMVKGSPMVLYGHDMLVQHIASRPGSVFPPGEIFNNRDAFVVSADPGAECYNIVLDHVSGSWSTDEILSTWSGRAPKVSGTVLMAIRPAAGAKRAFQAQTTRHLVAPGRFAERTATLDGTTQSR